mgnify:CR=1 FL=1
MSLRAMFLIASPYDVAEDFNAIGSCLKKEYTYRIFNSRIHNPRPPHTEERAFSNVSATVGRSFCTCQPW